MMTIGIVLRSTRGQPVPKNEPRVPVFQRCEAWDSHRRRRSAALPLQRAHRVIRDDLPGRASHEHATKDHVWRTHPTRCAVGAALPGETASTALPEQASPAPSWVSPR